MSALFFLPAFLVDCAAGVCVCGGAVCTQVTCHMTMSPFLVASGLTLGKKKISISGILMKLEFGATEI